jgi:predicted DNA-binding transcriptional regulator AlpA
MPRVNTEDLIDANDVARMLGLAHRNTVSQYLHKYPDMPRPVIDLGGSRARLWIRQDIERYIKRRGPVRRGRPRGSTNPLEDNRPPLGGGRQQGVAGHHAGKCHRDAQPALATSQTAKTDYASPHRHMS